jgi:hypothetical protein
MAFYIVSPRHIYRKGADGRAGIGQYYPRKKKKRKEEKAAS